MTTKTIINADHINNNLSAVEYLDALYEKHCVIPQSIGEVHTKPGNRYKIAVRATKPIQKEQPEGVRPDYIMSWIPKNDVPQEYLESGLITWKAVMWTFPKLGGILGRTMRSINNAPMLFLFHPDFITCAIDGIYPGVFDNKFSAITILRSCKEQQNDIFLAECIAFSIKPNTDKKCTYKRSKKVSYVYPTGKILPYTTAIGMKINLKSKDWSFLDEGLWESVFKSGDSV